MTQTPPRWTMIIASLTIAVAGCATMGTPERILGWTSEFGEGTVSSYARLDAAGVLQAIGVSFSARTLNGPRPDLTSTTALTATRSRSRTSSSAKQSRLQDNVDPAPCPLAPIASYSRICYVYR